MSDSEDDIWGYRSIRKSRTADSKAEKPASCEKTPKAKEKERSAKKKRAAKGTSCTRNNKSPISNGISPSPAKEPNSVVSGGDISSTPKRTARANSKKVSPATPKTKHSGYCPSCQMPFSILLVQTPRWHVSECLDIPSDQTECPDGLACLSTIPSHYKRYSHFLLAQSRDAQSSPFSPFCMSESLSPPRSNTSISPMRANVTRCSQVSLTNTSKNANLKSSQGKSPASSQGSGKQTSLNAWLYSPLKASQNFIELSQELPSSVKAAGTADEDNCFISYSPLVSDQELFSEDDETDTAGPVRKLFSKKYTTDAFKAMDGRHFMQENEKKTPTNTATINEATKANGVSACDECEADYSIEGLNWSICSTPVSEICEWTTTQQDPLCSTQKETAIKEEKVCTSTQPFTQGFTVNRPHAATAGIKESLSQSSLAMPSTASASATSSKSMKQMDIGVFFGLKPKAKPVEKSEVKLPLKTQSPNAVASQAVKQPRKRKAGGSLGDAESLASNATAAAAPSGTQKRQRKPFRENSTAEGNKGKKQCPFYKKIPGTGFVVDAFQYGAIEGCSAYFLTHFHSDHYGGLSKKFRYPIYCSKITGNLVASKLRVEKEFINTLPMESECIVDNVKVILLDANHCPGAVLLLFILPNGTTILHTGDFRADTSMERYPALIGRRINTLYLDTTYCSPEYTFPPQQEAVQFAVNTAFETLTLYPRTLVVCGTYSVGKEKVFLAIADVLGCKVCMSQDKYKTMQCLESEEIRALVTTDWNSTALHVLPMMQVNFKGLSAHLNKFPGKYDRVLAFKPTGWTYSEGCGSVSDIRPEIRGKITIYGIPYSEHSSYLEMKRFVQFIRPHKIIPTVNVGNWKARSAMEKYFAEWLSETGHRSATRQFKGQ
ncbi:DNA cross-link repair 1A protein [Gastrophryne carolinensis]